MTTRFDDDPDGPEPAYDDPHDPLLVVLRPGADHLGPPPGRYEAIRRAASRRRLLRTAAGAAAVCAAAAVLFTLPVPWTAADRPAGPAAPPAPRPAVPSPSVPGPVPTPSVSVPGEPVPATPAPAATSAGQGAAPTEAGPSAAVSFPPGTAAGDAPSARPGTPDTPAR